MSTEYGETLKKIKETEEAGNREVADKKKSLEDELKALEAQSDASIDAARSESESYITSEVEKARKAAQADADALLASSEEKADETAKKKLDKKELTKIIDKALLTGFEEE
jgi:vacuolar-type H+-ATPase subunit H